jgi:hypothetical protein
MSKLIENLITIQQQMRVFHWQTHSFAQHEAFGSAYESLDKLVDNFVEVYLGKSQSRITANSLNITLSVNVEPIEFLSNCIEYFNQFNTVFEESDSDLLNIRDEMLAVINKLKYLLTLK